MLIGQHIVQKQGARLAATGATEPLHEVPNFPPCLITCRLRLPCLWNLPPHEKQVDGIGKFEADWITMDMLFGCPP